MNATAASETPVAVIQVRPLENLRSFAIPTKSLLTIKGSPFHAFDCPFRYPTLETLSEYAESEFDATVPSTTWLEGPMLSPKPTLPRSFNSSKS